MQIQSVLNTPIKELPFTAQFKSYIAKMQLITVEELLQTEVASLPRAPGFNYHILQEWVQFLEENNLAHLLRV